MPDKKISQLPNNFPLTGAELIEIVQAADNKKTNLTAIAAFVASTLPTSSTSPGLPLNSVQYNDNNTFAGDANFTWNSEGLSLGPTPAQSAQRLYISSIDNNADLWIDTKYNQRIVFRNQFTDNKWYISSDALPTGVNAKDNFGIGYLQDPTTAPFQIHRKFTYQGLNVDRVLIQGESDLDGLLEVYGEEIITKTATTTNDAVSLLTLIRTTNTSPAIGIGSKIDFKLKAFDNQIYSSGSIINKFTTVAAATRTSQFIIQTVDSAVTQDSLTLNGNGQLRLNRYGSVTPFTGTTQNLLGVTSNGSVIEVPEVIKTFKVNLSANDMTTLGTVLAIPAPGQGKAICIIEASVKYNYKTTPFSSTNLALISYNSTAPQFFANPTIFTKTTNVWNKMFQHNNIAPNSNIADGYNEPNIVENENMLIYISPISNVGDGDVVIYGTYREIEI